MKKLFIIATFVLPLLFAGCNSPKNNAAEEDVAPNTEETQTGNPYISDTQAEETPVTEEDLSGEVITLTASEFIKRVTDIYDDQGFRYKGYTPCIVDFYAEWCGPCQHIKPMMARMAKKYKGKLIIYKINVDHARDICDVFGIESIPTLIFFNRTEQPKKMVGAPSKSELENAINDFLSK